MFSNLLTLCKRNLALFILFRKIDIMKMLEYRASFLFWVAVSVSWTMFNVLFFSILTSVSDSIAGWSKHEIFLLLGVFTMIDSLTWSLFHPNMSDYTRDIYSGGLSLLLAKPVNTQFYLMTRRLNPQIVFRFLIGLLIVIGSLHSLDVAIQLQTVILFVTFLFFSSLLIYSIWFCISTTAFFFERLDNINEIIPSIRPLWQIPRSAYGGAFAVFFTNVIPLLLITTVPSEILLQRQFNSDLLLLAISSIVALLFSNLFFKFAIRHFSGMAN